MIIIRCIPELGIGAMKRKRDSLPHYSTQDENEVEQLMSSLASASSITTQILQYINVFESQKNSFQATETVNFIRSRVAIILELIQELVNELEFIHLEDHETDTYNKRVNSITEQALQCQDFLRQLPLKDLESDSTDPRKVF
ncbi:1915_t:CDS:2 [Acaulospora morrowiae]|uniref:1915_t:CDS:1 n=1 Tax=Acaulospora morrowiae TaxID=94023 RepID=A0A9N9CEN3_9GLOM|nr:1915_t:CDS:2 [Acaulospora morrowiae]